MDKTFLEEKIYKLKSVIKEYLDVIISSLVVAFISHTFALTNKLVNADDFSALFSKGATITSGRWALELTKYLFPNYSMPWIYGLFTIAFVTIAACFVVRAFNIKSKILRCLTGALLISFPSVTAYICYMFTSASYSLGLLLAVISFYFATRNGLKNKLISVGFLTVATGIYQMYILFASSLMIVFLLKLLLIDEVNEKEVLKEGVSLVIILAVSFALYYLIQILFCKITGAVTENADYGIADSSLARRILTVYTAMAGIFFKGYFGYIRDTVSVIVHICALICLGIGIILSLKGKKPFVIILTAVLLILWPVSVNGLYLIASPSVIHVLSQFPFFSYYILIIIFADKYLRLRDVCSICLAIVIGLNVYAANGTYLKLKLNYETAYSYYTSLLTNIYSTEGYKAGMEIKYYGVPELGIYDNDTSFQDITCLACPVRYFYSVNDFIKIYLGRDVEISQVVFIPEFISDMEVYPSYGGIRIVDDVVYVRFT